MILKIDNINVFYGNIHALRDVSLEVNEGEIVALIGANGAGKSTTLKTVSGLLRSETGSISFLEQDISKEYPHKLVSRGLRTFRRDGIFFRSFLYLLTLSLEHILAERYRQRISENVYTHFPRLKERRNQTAGTLSGGEQQMLAIGRAMMSHPKLIMLDEPSMGLAPILVDQIFEIISELHKSGTTILLVEQNANKALEIADRAYVMESGRIVLTGTGHELAESDSIKKAYLGG